jgi:Fe-S-cluster-containing dehydrogenase component
MTRYGMVIDVNKCTGCYSCFVACRDEHCGNDYSPIATAQPYKGHFWLRIVEKERGQYPKVKVDYTAVPCMHCDNAPCIEVGENGAVYKRPDGIVIIDPEKAKGRKDILQSCPYRVIYWNEEKDLPQKCTLCAHLLDDGWTEPRCVEACSTGALLFGDLNDPNSAVAKRVTSPEAETMHPEYGLDEKVRYVGLPKRFVAGTVVLLDIDECAVNAEVTLSGNGLKKMVKTDGFGDFEFEGLPADNEYAIQIAYPGYKSKEIATNTRIDISLGNISLDKN